jgi:hypothetical protein
MFVMKSVDDLWNHIAYVLGYAPDRFPYEDSLSAEDQMTLDKAFEQLHAGVLVAYPEAEWRERRDELHELLDRSYLAYRAGDEMRGATLLNELEDRIFQRPT